MADILAWAVLAVLAVFVLGRFRHGQQAIAIIGGSVWIALFLIIAVALSLAFAVVILQFARGSP